MRPSSEGNPYQGELQMNRTRQTAWLGTLEDVETSISGCLAVLEKYENKFAEILANTADTDATLPQEIVPVVLFDEASIHEVPVAPTTLLSASTIAEEVEELLVEQEELWRRWREAYDSWMGAVKRYAKPAVSKAA